MSKKRSRREFLAAAGSFTVAAGLPSRSPAQSRDLRGSEKDMQMAIARVTGGAPVTKGRVKIDLPPLDMSEPPKN